MREVYQKHELLEQLEEDDEVPEWREDISDFLPTNDRSKTPAVTSNESQSALPKVEGDSEFHQKIRDLLAKYKEVFLRTVTATPAQFTPMKLELTDES